MKAIRSYGLLDQCCFSIDHAVRAIFNNPHTTGRISPASDQADSLSFTPKERKHAAGLLRVNHTGEVCAQALYHGQALVSRSPDVKQKMHQAAMEEGDHLAWCYLRLIELDSHTSYLNSFWYMNSFLIGLIAGLAGDKWSLGFLAETEKQVAAHLENQLARLPAHDSKSIKILEQMQLDEAQHRETAIQAGGIELPIAVKKAMRLLSRVMVKIAYWI